MTKQTRELLVFIITLIVIALLVGLLAWATSGFTNWNPPTWFDSWAFLSSKVKPLVNLFKL